MGMDGQSQWERTGTHCIARAYNEEKLELIRKSACFICIYPKLTMGFALGSSPPEGGTSYRSQSIQDILPLDMLLHVAKILKSASISFTLEPRQADPNTLTFLQRHSNKIEAYVHQLFTLHKHGHYLKFL
jgi:hypothetical protein